MRSQRDLAALLETNSQQERQLDEQRHLTELLRHEVPTTNFRKDDGDTNNMYACVSQAEMLMESTTELQVEIAEVEAERDQARSKAILRLHLPGVLCVLAAVGSVRWPSLCVCDR